MSKKVKEDLRNKILDLEEGDKDFSFIFELEEKFILNKIKLENGIAENRPLGDNVFLLFVSINLNQVKH